VTRGVDDVDTVVLPLTRGSGGRNGYTALLFLLHPVHGGATFVNFTHAVQLTGVVQDTLCSRRLTSINVRHDADVARLFKRENFGHC